eukprot:scaffold3378_cov66-Phaeocystis_antarctica.AAC.2
MAGHLHGNKTALGGPDAGSADVKGAPTVDSAIDPEGAVRDLPCSGQRGKAEICASGVDCGPIAVGGVATTSQTHLGTAAPDAAIPIEEGEATRDSVCSQPAVARWRWFIHRPISPAVCGRVFVQDTPAVRSRVDEFDSLWVVCGNSCAHTLRSEARRVGAHIRMNAALPRAPTKDLAVILDGYPSGLVGVNCGVPSIGWPRPPGFIETIVEPYPGDVPTSLDEAPAKGR